MIQISKKSLSEAMKGFRSLRIQNNTLEILRLIRLRTHGANTVLEATNLDETLEYCCDCERGETDSLNCLVPYEVLREAERHADRSENIGVDRNKIRYSAGGVAIDRPFEEKCWDDFPAINMLHHKVEILDVDSVNALQEAAGYTSSDSTRYLMSGVHISPDYIAATDGKRLYTCNNRNINIPDTGIIVPSRSSLKLFDSGTDMQMRWVLTNGGQVDSNKIALCQGRWRLIMKLVEGTFPNWKPLLKAALKGDVTELTIDEDDANTLIKALPALAGAHLPDFPVNLTIAEQYARLTGHDQNNLQELELRKSRWRGYAAGVKFNRNFLLQGLNMGLRKILIKGPMDAVLMQDGKGMRKVIWMPLRGNQENVNPQTESDDTQPQTTEQTGDDNSPDSSAQSNGSGENNEEQDAEVESFSSAACHRSVAPAGYGSGRGQYSVPQPNNTDEAEATEEDPWSLGMEACVQLREQLRTALSALSNLQGYLRKSKQDHIALKRDSRALRKGIRELQKLEI